VLAITALVVPLLVLAVSFSKHRENRVKHVQSDRLSSMTLKHWYV
jgi:hypothetical protein